MTTLQKVQIVKLKELYEKDNLSAQKIADILDCSIHSVYYAMRKHNIARRSQTENSKILFERKNKSFTVKEKLSLSEEKLKLAGIMLYWAEGYKTNKSPGIDFANCDSGMLLIFIKFLRKVCQVDESRFRVLLYSHNQNDISKQIKYWSTQLKIPPSQFTKPYIQTKNNQLAKRNKMPYGLVHIRYYDKKLLRQILLWIDECKQNI